MFVSSNCTSLMSFISHLLQLINGIWGTVAVGFFAEPTLMLRVYKDATHFGAFYSDGILLACQIVGILFTIGWVGGIMLPFFWTLHYFGFLR